MSELEKVVLSWYDDREEGWCANYSILSDHTKLTKEELKPVIAKLKQRGYLAFANGLVDDEGIPAGSGWYRTEAGSEAYYEAKLAALKESA